MLFSLLESDLLVCVVSVLRILVDMCIGLSNLVDVLIIGSLLMFVLNW